MQFHVYLALIFGVSAMKMNQASVEENFLVQYPDPNMYVSQDGDTAADGGNATDGTGDPDSESDEEDEEKDEDDLLQWIEEHIKEHGSVTLMDIKKMIKGHMKEIMKAEMKHIMKEVRKGFKACDTNKDKKVDADEFAKCMEKAHEGHDHGDV